VAAGRLSRQKGFDRLLKAWAKVTKDHPDWELRIYGEGHKGPRLQQWITDLGIGSTARLMGFTPHLDQELAQASLYVMSSRREGFPMVLLEAMAVGLPVVSFNCPTGPRDIIREGVDGHVVRNADIDGLAAAMSGLMGDEDRRRAYGAAAVEVAERYSISRIARRWEELLEEAAAAKDPGLPRTVLRPTASLARSAAKQLVASR
jgi:glycosyltransferase involved in cell wall biosynthesis